MKKGPLIDLIENKSIFMSLDSRLTMISKLTAVRTINRIIKLKMKNQIFNITGSGSFLLKSLKEKYSNIRVLNNTIYNYDINISKIRKYFDIPTSSNEVKKLIKF